MSRSIPVLTYHMVRPEGPITPEIFEQHLQWLVQSGCRTIHSSELARHLIGEQEITSPAVQITFDDGWLDNWIYAFPLLQKYNLKATIFVITSRIKTQLQTSRPNLTDLWQGRATAVDLPQLKSARESFFQGLEGGSWDDYLSWIEIQKMVQAGNIEIQSHSHTHAYYFSGQKVVDFNRLRHWKIAWATDGDFRLGIPEYEGASALLVRRYHDPVEIRDQLAAEAIRVKAEEWLTRKNAKKKFWKYFHTYYATLAADVKQSGHYEAEQIFQQRVRAELQQSKHLIEMYTGQECSFLCWPWGEYNPLSLARAREAGYRGTYTLDRGSNKPGDAVDTIRRFEIRPAALSWFASRILLYSHPGLAALYQKIYHRF